MSRHAMSKHLAKLSIQWEPASCNAAERCWEQRFGPASQAWKKDGHRLRRRGSGRHSKMPCFLLGKVTILPPALGIGRHRRPPVVTVAFSVVLGTLFLSH